MRSRAPVLACACALLVGCGSTAPSAHGPMGPPHVVPGELDARILLEDLPARATKLGAGPVSIVASGEVTEGERTGAFVDIAEGACLLAYARASSSLEDIDVAAFGEEGNPVASDEGPDAHPAVVVCPQHASRVYVVAHAASGEGLVALAAQQVPRDRAAELARAFSARGGAAQGAHAADAWPGLEDHVRAHRDALGGKWEEVRRVAVTLDARAPTFVGFSIAADQCLDVMVVPDEDVALVELEAQDGEGRLIARSREAGRDRALTICSPLTFDGSFVLRPHVGNGIAAVVIARAPADHVRDPSSRAQLAWTSATGSVDINKAARDGELVKSGYAAATSTSTGTLVVGRRSTVSLDFGTKNAKSAPCNRVDVVGGEPLALVDAEVWSAAGELVTRAQGSSSATVFSCAHPKAEIDLEARGRPGPYSILARPERWADAVFTTHPIAAARMLSASTSGVSSHIEGTVIAVKTFSLDATHRATFDESIKAGQCLDIAVGGEGEGTYVDLRVSDAGTSEELDRDSGAFGARARACAPPNQARAIRIELRAAGKMTAVVGERTRP